MDHEEAFVEAFVEPDRRARALLLIKSRTRDRKHRSKFDTWLSHGVELVPERSQLISPKASVTDALAQLLQLGAPPECWMISTTQSSGFVSAADGLWECFSGKASGRVILSFVPGVLALYAQEFPPGDRFLLQRNN